MTKNPNGKQKSNKTQVRGNFKGTYIVGNLPEGILDTLKIVGVYFSSRMSGNCY